MATTGTSTVRDICEAALRKIGFAKDEIVTAEDVEDTRAELNRMLKSWQVNGPNLWAYSKQSLTLTTAQSFTLDPIRPLEIISARLKNGNIETPMISMTRQEYDDLPLKSSTGRPTQYYYDKQREDALFYIWPVLATAAGETIEITYIRELEDIASLNDEIDVPSEWYDCVVYNLADRMADDWDINAPKVTQRAMMLYDAALADDCEESVFFHGYG